MRGDESLTLLPALIAFIVFMVFKGPWLLGRRRVFGLMDAKADEQSGLSQNGLSRHVYCNVQYVEVLHLVKAGPTQEDQTLEGSNGTNQLRRTFHHIRQNLQGVGPIQVLLLHHNFEAPIRGGAPVSRGKRKT